MNEIKTTPEHCAAVKEFSDSLGLSPEETRAAALIANHLIRQIEIVSPVIGVLSGVKVERAIDVGAAALGLALKTWDVMMQAKREQDHAESADFGTRG